jgi:hypothetical protein
MPFKNWLQGHWTQAPSGCAPRSPRRRQDLEILLLRHQLQVLQREPSATPRHALGEADPGRAHRQLSTGDHRPAHSVRQVLPLFKSDTVLKWHRDLVRRKWTVQRTMWIAAQPSLLKSRRSSCASRRKMLAGLPAHPGLGGLTPFTRA